MTEETLNSLMLLYVHKDIPLNYDTVIDIFAAKQPRRMLLQNFCTIIIIIIIQLMIIMT